MSTPHYTLEAGRSILRDGKRFAYIARTTTPATLNASADTYVEPADVDQFTRDVVRMANAHQALVRAATETMLALDLLVGARAFKVPPKVREGLATCVGQLANALKLAQGEG